MTLEPLENQHRFVDYFLDSAVKLIKKKKRVTGFYQAFCEKNNVENFITNKEEKKDRIETLNKTIKPNEKEVFYIALKLVLIILIGSRNRSNLCE